MKEEHVTRWRIAAVTTGGLVTVLGFALCAVVVPRVLVNSRGLANLLVVLAAFLIAGSWMLVGAGTRRFGGRIWGALFGLFAYLFAGVLWTAGFVLIDPWQVDFRQVDLVRFIVYSVLLWPYALVYTFDWLGLGGI
ncbi:hypothetical protein HRbin28_00179 [bacterium HR28]|uniref:Uncharacterized protein n=1 Tax=Thermomicrobium roseum TaxID=500 RepID=A0A7C1JNB6_THERO|nr:hypothetical protein HRbin28_00179 [bacterium HR28]